MRDSKLPVDRISQRRRDCLIVILRDVTLSLLVYHVFRGIAAKESLLNEKLVSDPIHTGAVLGHGLWDGAHGASREVCISRGLTARP